VQSARKEKNLIDFRKSGKDFFQPQGALRFFVFGLCSLVYIFLGWTFGLYRKAFIHRRPANIRRLIVLGFGGIGNHLMLTPALLRLKETDPARCVHLAVSSTACGEVLQSDPNVDSLSVLNATKCRTFKELIKTGLTLRKLSPDIFMAASGINPVTGGIIALLSGAKVRVGEEWHGRGFLYTHKIQVDSKVFEGVQNLKLANLVDGCSIATVPPIILKLAAAEMAEAKRWLADCSIPTGATVIGMHPGSGPEQKWKRWDTQKFVRLARHLSQTLRVFTIFFVGPDEGELVDGLKSSNNGSSRIYQGQGSIRKTAARIASCDLFLSNDSGLRQIAVALGVRTFGIFGPTGIRKNYMADKQHTAIFRKNVRCRPCHYTRWRLACGEQRPCLKHITVDQVYKAMVPHLNRAGRSPHAVAAVSHPKQLL
jgi:heptosyltransferase-2